MVYSPEICNFVACAFVVAQFCELRNFEVLSCSLSFLTLAFVMPFLSDSK